MNKKLQRAHDAAKKAIDQYADVLEELYGECQDILLISDCGPRDVMIMSRSDCLADRARLLRLAVIDAAREAQEDHEQGLCDCGPEDRGESVQ